MECPKCASEMKKGFFIFQRSIFWSDKKKNIKLVALEDEKLYTSKLYTFAQFGAFRCEKCNSILFQIPEK